MDGRQSELGIRCVRMGIRILVIEDDLEIADFLVRGLARRRV